MKITNESLLPFLIYNSPIKYSECIILYPVTMSNIFLFQSISKSITLRKNSIFREKKIIKMSYLNFLIYAFKNKELESEYNICELSNYYFYAIQLLQLCCKNQEIKIDETNGSIYINNELITSEIFDNLRRIIIIQNGIDFDIDEFINYETEQKLLEAENKANKNSDKSTIEDYIDSLVLIMNVTEKRIMNMSIRKFWRYIKRYNLHENYTIAKTGESTGMVSYKEPIKHWMISLEEEDKYKNLKTDENELKNKIG